MNIPRWHSRVIHLVIALALVVSLGLAMTPLATVGAATQNEEFIENGTFIVPETVTEITIQAWGGGGAGGGSTDAGWFRVRGGAGGGGGAYADSILTVEPGQELQIVVGAGGAGVSGANGNAGSPSFVGPDINPDNAFVRAAGGSGGAGNTAGGSPAGGAGGTVEDSIGQNRIAGGDGEDGATGHYRQTSSGAGGDGANSGGSGGAALTGGTSNGNPGDAPSGGGGGGRTQGDNGSQAGGDGAAGKILVTWVTYDLTISSMDGGSVITPGEGIFTYGKEAIVDLVAEAEEGYRFLEWTGNVSTIADVYDASTTITMNSDCSITAEFVRQYDLTTSSTEGGSVTTPGEGLFNYDEGTVVDLVATPGADYWFVEWTGNVGTIADVYDASTTITMNSDCSITATFMVIYDLSASSTAGGSVTTPGEGVFTYGEASVVGLAAEAEEDYQFVQWTGDVGTIADVYAASTAITMNGDYSITANFEVVPLSVTTKAATDITADSSILNMGYTVGDFDSVQVRFAYKESASLFWSNTDWVSKSRSGTYAETLTGLRPNTEYDFIAQLKHNDTEIEGTILQFTTDTPSPSGGCFIATATYGTSTAEQIDVLREFRDVVLLESIPGSQFVALYYQLSPPVADIIAGNTLLRTLVRELLVDPIVWIVEATGDIWRN